MDMVMDFTTMEWFFVVFCALMVGFSKTGILGAGILVVPMLAAIIPARESTGFLLPMLAMADIIAIIYWRKHVEWRQLGRLLPWALTGILFGCMFLRNISNTTLMPLIGGLILVLVGVRFWWNSHPDRKDILPTGWWFAGIMGILAGCTSMLANAAGPIMTIYLLTMKLEKKEFVGTGAWFFWIINLSKMPFSYKLGFITPISLGTNLLLLPAIVGGGILGILLVHRIPQKIFNVIVEVLAITMAVYLCVKPFL